jgi:transposase
MTGLSLSIAATAHWSNSYDKRSRNRLKRAFGEVARYPTKHDEKSIPGRPLQSRMGLYRALPPHSLIRRTPAGPSSTRDPRRRLLHRGRSGCAWRWLPYDFPPSKTVYHYFRLWRIDRHPTNSCRFVSDTLVRRLRNRLSLTSKTTHPSCTRMRRPCARIAT